MRLSPGADSAPLSSAARHSAQGLKLPGERWPDVIAGDAACWKRRRQSRITAFAYAGWVLSLGHEVSSEPARNIRAQQPLAAHLAEIIYDGRLARRDGDYGCRRHALDDAIFLAARIAFSANAHHGMPLRCAFDAGRAPAISGNMIMDGDAYDAACFLDDAEMREH